MTPRFRLVTLAAGLVLATSASLHAQAALDSLVAADAALSDAGLTAALAHAANGLVLVYPGAPVIAGRAAANAMLDAQRALWRLTVHWVPVHGEISRDGNFGVTYGVLAITDSSGAMRFGKYLSAWTRGTGGWELAAYAPVGLVPANAFVKLCSWQPGTPAIASSATGAAVADSLFAAQAGREGAEAAFAAWIAEDGAMFAGSGEIIRGSGAAHRLLGGNRSAWRWWPVAAIGTADLAVTIGEAVITPPGGAPFSSHYLTQWRRQDGGAMRFIADGGSARPDNLSGPCLVRPPR